MKKNELLTIAAAAVEKFGEASQVFKACEELAELQWALMRWANFCTIDEYSENDVRYGKALLENIHEELADVCIMCMQLEQIFGHDAEMMERKVEHLRELVEMEK